MKILITGSCGFIGTNLIKRYAPHHQVIGIDNLSRYGSESNLLYLRRNYVFDFRKVDITTFDMNELPEVDVIFHMAAQVGVQRSIQDPIFDFNQNIIGTVKLLEFARKMKKKPVFIFASTNKVYGDIDTDIPVNEETPLNFHTPYGVSKGSADQYVLDYSRMYGVKGVVFRQSCIYGEHQLGSEEQGWVAWFIIANKHMLPITIYGDGNQRRDTLYVKDLIRAYDLAIKNPKTWGKAFNIGGGVDNTLSLNELVEKAHVNTVIYFSKPRPSDQRYYVSDITKFSQLTSWYPTVGVDKGIEILQKSL